MLHASSQSCWLIIFPIYTVCKYIVHEILQACGIILI